MRELLNRLRSFVLRERRDAEFDEEMAAHIAFATEEFVQAGLSPVEARRQALLRFGGRISAQELQLEARSLPFLERFLQDLRYSMRTMRREPGFTVFAVLISALGIGASVTVFSVLNTLLVRPLPFSQPDRLAWIANEAKDGDLSGSTLQVNPLLAYQRANHSFTEIAAYFAFYGSGDAKLQAGGRTERLDALPISENFFPLLGVQPELGRYFSSAECKWNAPKVALLSHGLWERRFASDPKIVGRKIILDDAPVTVVGVMPGSFDFGSVFAPGTHMDLYVPFPLSAETDRWGNTLSVVGKLRPGMTVQAAQAEAGLLSQQISKEQPRSNGLRLQLVSLPQHVSGKIRPALLLLGFAVAVVMLIVCANISNLLLVRSLGRQKEFAVRTALGAGRSRLMAQILTESLLLSAMGAVLGVLFAFVGTRSLAHLTAYHLPLLNEVRFDWPSLLFTLSLAFVTGVVFGMIPALQVPSVTVHDALKAQTRGATDSRKHAWLRSCLVVAEVAFACVLIVSTGLLIRSFLRVLDVDLGFQPSRAFAMRIDPSASVSTDQKMVAFISEALRRVREIPGVEAAGIGDNLPLGRNRTWGAAVVGQTYKPDEFPLAFVHLVTEGYWQALSIPLKEGRTFTERDTAANKLVTVVNETFARHSWPGQDPIGKQILGGGNKPYEVVGVVRDVRHIALEQGSGNEMYFSMRQLFDFQALQLVVRSRLDSVQLGNAIRATLHSLDSGMPYEQLQPVQKVVDQSVSPRRFFVSLLSGFSLFALALASLGIYAVVSYSVGQRQQEIGIRMALGASPESVQSAVLRQTLVLALLGIVVGAVLSGVLTQAMRGLLFGITPGDPATFGAMLAVLVAVAIAAGYLPALRASRIDPTLALRAD